MLPTFGGLLTRASGGAKSRLVWWRSSEGGALDLCAGLASGGEERAPGGRDPAGGIDIPRRVGEDSNGGVASDGAGPGASGGADGAAGGAAAEGEGTTLARCGTPDGG